LPASLEVIWAEHTDGRSTFFVRSETGPPAGDWSAEMMELTADAGLTILTYTAEPGSKSAEALNLLASWTATLDEAEPSNVTDR